MTGENTSAGSRRLLAIVVATVIVVVVAVSLVIVGVVLPALNSAHRGASSPADLPNATYCQGPVAHQAVPAPRKIVLIVLENESASTVGGSPDAPFANNTLTAQCGHFARGVMHNTTHGSEGNYIALTAGLNGAIDSGNDALARFTLSDCPPDSAELSCEYGGGHLAATVPSVFSQIEKTYGPSGWRTFSDDMPIACDKNDAHVYATTPTAKYRLYVARHNPAVFFDGIHCRQNDVPAGDWKNGTGALYAAVKKGTLPPFTYLQPNDRENGHDPVAENGITVAGGASRIANIDQYLSAVMSMIRSGPDYQRGNLVVVVTFDEGAKSGAVKGDDKVGQNCADPNISPLATSCQVQTWIVGRYVPHYSYPSYMNQFGLLAATERILKLPTLLGHAADSSTPNILTGTAANPDPFNISP
jgi:Phosphoesterase family.